MNEQKNLIKEDLFSRIGVTKHLIHLDVLNKDIEIRPYAHGDTKTLLAILSKYQNQKNPKGFEKDIVYAQKNLVENCILGDITGEKINILDLPVADYIKTVIELKRFTTGETTPLRFKCVNEDCEDETKQRYIKDFVFDVDDCHLNSEQKDKKTIEIEMGGQNVKFHMREYSFGILFNNIEFFSGNLKDQDKINSFYVDFIDSIEFPDKSFDNLPKEMKIEFMNKMTPKQTKEIMEYANLRPKYIWEKEWECPICGAKNISALREVSDFFFLL